MAKQESIRKRVKPLRLEQGLSQRQLGDSLDRVTYGHIGRIESDTRPSLRTCVASASALD